MAVKSAGLVMYKRRNDGLYVLLVHPGGPYWRRKDAGAWSIPKGEYADDEDPEAVARREFKEELGSEPHGAADYLDEVVQAGGKRVVAYALEGDLDVTHIESNTFEMEWPPRSGKQQSFPEVDRAEWFALSEARKRILDSQRPLLDRLEEVAAGRR